MSSVRAKFRVDSIEKCKWGDGKIVETIKMSPIMSGSEENKAFYAASPSGSINLGCANPEAAKMFELSECYYIDFTPAPK